MVNFMCQCDWIRGYLAQRFSGCVCEGVLEEIYRLSKADCPTQFGWASSNPLRV